MFRVDPAIRVVVCREGRKRVDEGRLADSRIQLKGTTRKAGQAAK
jgi:hypothetical protein